MDKLEEFKATVNPTKPIAPVSAAPTTPTPIGPSNFLTLIPPSIKTFILTSICFLCFLLTCLCHALCSPLGPSPAKVAQTSQFEIGSNSTTISNPVSQVAAFFTRFDQAETNDLDLIDLWGTRSPYIDFHGFWVPKECVTRLEAVYSDHRDFMQGLPFGRSIREYFLKLLGCVMNAIKHNFINIVFAERILQWRAAV